MENILWYPHYKGDMDFAAPVECTWWEGGRGGSFCSKDPLKWPWLCHLIPQQPAQVTMRGCRDSGEKLWYRFKLKRKKASFWFECKKQIPDSTCVGSACHQISSVLVYTGCFCSCLTDWNEDFIAVCLLKSHIQLQLCQPAQPKPVRLW